jgi:hypothetical protein
VPIRIPGGGIIKHVLASMDNGYQRKITSPERGLQLARPLGGKAHYY